MCFLHRLAYYLSCANIGIILKKEELKMIIASMLLLVMVACSVVVTDAVDSFQYNAKLDGNLHLFNQ